MRAGRWSTRGIRPSWTGGRPRICACPSGSAIPRRACTSGSWRSAGSRARIRRCSAGSSAGGGSIAWSRTASPSWSGHREARRSISARPGPWSRAWNGSCVFPGGVVPVLEHALGGRPSRRDLGVRVPGFAVDLRAHGHGAQGGGVRQRHRRGPSQAGRHGRPDPLVLPVLRALRVRTAVLQPVFRPREGQRGERGRLSPGAT